MTSKNGEKLMGGPRSRFREVTQDELRTLSGQLNELRAELDACVAKMKDKHIKSIPVDGATKGQRGVEMIVEFEAAIEAAIKKKIFFPNQA